jgi:uncharacterized protein with PIN domain
MHTAEQNPVTVWISFHADLYFFIPAALRGRVSEIRFGHATSLKDLVESCGIPHTEVGYLFRNGSDAAFSDRISDGDRIGVFPVWPPMTGLTLLQPAWDVQSGFIADVNLGRLTRRMRLLGFDVRYFTGRHDSELLHEMRKDGRILLTRDRRLLMNNLVLAGYCVRSDGVLEQTGEVLRRFGLFELVRPFSRCLVCNALLASCPKGEARPLIEPKTRRYYHQFSRCTGCGKVYWEGSHVLKLREFIDKVLPGGGHSVL